MSMRGIDVSRFQSNVNWVLVDASGISFALVKAGFGNDASQKDANFGANINGAFAAGLHVGAYWFGYATSIQDAQKEADAFNQILSPYRGKLTFPVAYDYEYDSVRYFKERVGREPSNAEIDSFVQAFNDRMKSYGWFVNIYTNLDYYRSGKFTNSVKKYDVWLADYSGGPDYPCYIQQTGDKGSVPGISGNVDMDISFRDYPTIIKAGGYNGFPKPQANYSCDTSGTVEITRGNAYQALITCSGTPNVVAGTADVATVLHRYDDGDKHYYFIVPIGRSGQEAGIYINGGPRQFVARVK